MTSLTTNLRKAAILLRSVDAETATSLLTQLSPAEADAIRAAIQSLGPIESDERADVAAEFRRVGTVAAEDPRRGVELDLSSAAAFDHAAFDHAKFDHATFAPATSPSKPFEFLEQARVESLVPYLAREQGQTVAVVLSYLPPTRAAEVLAALPAPLQAETLERLSTLGETDPASLEVLERELAEWVARRQATRSRDPRRPDAVAAILAAADDTARSGILANLRKVNRALAEQMAPSLASRPSPATPAATPAVQKQVSKNGEPAASNRPPRQHVARSEPRAPAPRNLAPQIRFDDLAGLDSEMLAHLLKAVDAELWVLALAAANDAVVDRIAEQMPRATSKAFRRRLRQLGPTRLRDVEAAQREVVAVAARMIEQRASIRSLRPAFTT